MSLKSISVCLASITFWWLSAIAPAQAQSWDWNWWDWDCEADFTTTVRPLTWQANRNNLQRIRIDIRFTQRTDECVTEVLLFTDNYYYLSLNADGGSINTEITDRRRDVYPLYIVDGRIAWVVPINRIRNLRVFAQLVTNEPIIAGSYRGLLNIAASSYGYIVSDEKVANVDMEVPTQLSVSVQTSGNPALSGGQGFYYVEMGNMYQGKRVDWDLSIYTNTHYDVSVSSEYGGLRHRGTNALIDYDIIMDGQRFSAANGYTKRYINYSPLTTSAIPFAVEVGSTDFKPAGEYVDYMVVTVSAR